MRTALRGHAPAVVAAGLTVAAAALAPFARTPHSGHPSFLPGVLSLVLAFDLLATFLLVQQFLDTGNRRTLVMSWAYLWSLATMCGYAGAFPKVIAAEPPFATAPSVAPWLYIAWHTGFPVLLGLAWAPWPERWSRPCPPRLRRRVAARSLLAWVAAPTALVGLAVALGPSLPVLIDGLDTSRMTRLTAPVSLPLVLLAVLSTARAARHQSGPERWTAAAVWVCLLDLLLTYGARQRFSTGWYAGRTLTVLAAGIVVVAVVRETARATSALHRAEERQRTILDHLTEAVVLQDLDGHVVLANSATADVLPHLVPGAQSRRTDAVERDGTPVREEDRPSVVTVRTGRPLRDRVVGVTGPDGSRAWLSVNTTPVLSAEGDLAGVLSSYVDVTERELTREELVRTRDAAVAADTAKSAFLAMTSHEIRTPLNGLMGMTELLLRTDLSADQREFAETAKACGAQLLLLLNDVLDVSKAEAGKLELEPLPTDLTEVVHSAVAMVRESARAKGLALTWEVADDVPRWVMADALRLRQALANLVANAVKFTSSGSVAVTASRAGDLVRLAVTDTGPGVDAATADELFEPFRQADSSTTRVHGGTGLGLSIVREIAHLHGGTAGATGELGVGSTFWFTARLPETAAAPPVVVPAQRTASLSGRVLLAEDNLVNQRIAEMLLAELGVDVVTVADGRAAVDAVLAGGVDVVLMDCQMPVLDGLDATRELRALGSVVPVLALTASASAEDERACRAAGMDGYLTKPIDTAALASALEAALA